MIFGPFTQSFPIGDKAPDRAVRAVQVVFYPTRSRILAAGIDGFPPGTGAVVKWTSSYGGLHLVEASWEKPLPRAALRHLRATMTLEDVPLTALGITWQRSCPPKPACEERSSSGPLRMLWSTHLQSSLLAPPPDPDDPATRFFAALDGRTLIADGNAVPADKDKKEAMVVREFLIQRLNARMKAGPDQPATMPDPMATLPGDTLPRPLEDILQDMSQLQLDLVKANFCSGDDPPEKNSMAKVFIDFAAGKLCRTPKHNGTREPDSAYFFCFAEFAFAWLQCRAAGWFAQHPVQAEWWKSLLPGMVAAQTTYVAAYRPGQLPRSFVEWRFSTRPENPSDDEVQSWVDAGWADYLRCRGMTVRELEMEARANAVRALKDLPEGIVVCALDALLENKVIV